MRCVIDTEVSLYISFSLTLPIPFCREDLRLSYFSSLSSWRRKKLFVVLHNFFFFLYSQAVLTAQSQGWVGQKKEVFEQREREYKENKWSEQTREREREESGPSVKRYSIFVPSRACPQKASLPLSGNQAGHRPIELPYLRHSRADQSIVVWGKRIGSIANKGKNWTPGLFCSSVTRQLPNWTVHAQSMHWFEFIPRTFRPI